MNRISHHIYDGRFQIDHLMLQNCERQECNIEAQSPLKCCRASKEIITYCPPIQSMRNILKDQINIGRIGEGDEPKSSWSTSIRILHDHTVTHFSIATEVPEQGIVGCFPTQTADEHFPDYQNQQTINKLSTWKFDALRGHRVLYRT